MGCSWWHLLTAIVTCLFPFLWIDLKAPVVKNQYQSDLTMDRNWTANVIPHDISHTEYHAQKLNSGNMQNFQYQCVWHYDLPIKQAWVLV